MFEFSDDSVLISKTTAHMFGLSWHSWFRATLTKLEKVLFLSRQGDVVNLSRLLCQER